MALMGIQVRPIEPVHGPALRSQSSEAGLADLKMVSQRICRSSSPGSCFSLASWFLQEPTHASISDFLAVGGRKKKNFAVLLPVLEIE